jgi:hypothetical protein
MPIQHIAELRVDGVSPINVRRSMDFLVAMRGSVSINADLECVKATRSVVNPATACSLNRRGSVSRPLSASQHWA